MNERNKYHFLKKELRKLIKDTGKCSFYDDENIIDRILNLLTEGKSINKIKGVISTTEILCYGGDITDDKVDEVYEEIIRWWNEKQ